MNFKEYAKWYGKFWFLLYSDNENAEIQKREDVPYPPEFDRTHTQLRRITKFMIPKLKPIYQNGRLRKFDSISNNTYKNINDFLQKIDLSSKLNWYESKSSISPFGRNRK